MVRKKPYRHSYDNALWLYYEELYEDNMMHYQQEYDRSQEEILPPMFGFWDEKMHEYYDHYYREDYWKDYRENIAKENIIKYEMEDLMIERSYEEDQVHVEVEAECPLEPPIEIEDVESIDALAASEYLEMLELDHYLLNNDDSSPTSSAHDLEYEMEWWDRYLDDNYFDDSDDATSTYTPNEDEAVGYFPDDEDEDDICRTQHRKVATDTNTDMRHHTKQTGSFTSSGHHDMTATATTTASKQTLQVSDEQVKDLINSIGDDAYVYTSINPNPIDCRNHRFKRARDFVYRVSKRLRNR